MGKFVKAFQKTSSAGEIISTPGAGARTDSIERSFKFSGNKLDGIDNSSVREKWDERLKVSTDPLSPYFENFRRLRLPILYSPSGRQPRTILVTSAEPGEGKGFICANLGIAIAQDMEHHALMLDCDLRKPTLAQLFGLSNETGLSDHMQDNIDLSLLIRKTGQPKLSVIPAGKPPANPSELLSSSRMISLIDELASRYDDRIIIFDSPPNVVASETSVLARHLDGIILVVRHGTSKKEHVKKLVDVAGPEKILGVIFNACPEDKVESFLYRKLKYRYGSYGYKY